MKSTNGPMHNMAYIVNTTFLPNQKISYIQNKALVTVIISIVRKWREWSNGCKFKVW